MKTNRNTAYQNVPADGQDAAPGLRGALGGLSLAMLMASLGTSIANVALPSLSTAFGATFRETQWIVLAYLLAVTTLIVSVGRLGDLIGRRRLLLAGLTLFTSASVLCGAAPSLWLLIAARALQGLGAAVLMALSMALVSEAAPKGKTGRAMGLLGTMSAIGTALGPSLGGALISTLGWRAIFAVNLPLGVLAVALVFRYLPADAQRPKTDRTGFDKRGTLLLALTLSAYALAMTLGRGGFGALNAILLAAAAIGIALFAFAQSRSSFPLIPLAVFRDRIVCEGFALSALVSTVMMATLVVGPFYLSRGLGLGPTLVGIALSVGPLLVAMTGVPAGRIADRFGARTASTAGLVAIVIGCIALSLIPREVGVSGYIVPIAIITLGYAFFQTGNNTAVMKDVGAAQRGVISGMLNLSRNLGLITGASAMGAVFAFATGVSDISDATPAEVATGMRATFAVAAVLVSLPLAGKTLRRALRSPAPAQIEP